MAMLAEPRRRKRYNLCPRGKALYEDDSRFGTKMLEKMGWSKGRGLGANEDGSQDFVRIRFKNDAEGLGYETRDDQWTVHEEGFNGLLKSLNGDNEDDIVGGKTNENDSASEEESRPMGFGFKAPPVKDVKPKTLKEKISGVSLEEKSKSSKARVHYKKFTRGKDLSQYSEKDLANIFGKKADDINAPVVESYSVPIEEEETPINPNFAGVQTVSTGLSVNDYFRQKMEAMKNKLKQNAPENQVEQPAAVTANDSEEPVKKKKMKDKKPEREDNNLAAHPVEETAQQKKNKKSKRATEEDIAELEQKMLESEESNSQKSKKKKKKTQNEKDVEQSESSHDQDDAEIKRKRNSETSTKLEKANSASEETDPPKRKKKKKCKDVEAEEVNATEAVETAEINPTKRKKKKDKKEETQEQQISADEPTKCDIKKKGSKHTTEEVIITEEQQLTADKIAKKKHKKSKKETKELVDESEAAIKIQDKESTAKKSKKDKSDVSASETDSKADQEHEKFLSAEQLINIRDSYDIFTISSFCAEKFHVLEMSAFKNSTLSQIIGYGVNEDIKLKIVEQKHDADRIISLWESKNNKYSQRKEPAKIAIRKTKKQITKQIKRKAFLGI